MVTDKVKQYLNDRGITDAAIEKYGLHQSGLFGDGPAIVIPIEGFERLYYPWPGPGEPKIKWADKFREDQEAPPFPSWDAMNKATVLCEGEFDAIVAREQYGLDAASGTAGAGTFSEKWADCFVGREVTLIYDHDAPGRFGMVGGVEERINDAGHLVESHHVGACEFIAQAGGNPSAAYWPLGCPEKFDITDFWKAGYPRETLLAILQRATPYAHEVLGPRDPLAVRVPAPEEPELERTLLGSLLIGGHDLLAQVKAIVAPSDFSKEQYRLAYESMVSLYERGDAVDFKSVLAESKHLIAAQQRKPIRLDVLLLDCMGEIATASHAETYARAIRLAATRRSLIAVSANLQTLGYNSPHQTELDLVGAAQAEFTRLLDRHSESSSILVPKEHLMKYHDILDLRSKRDPSVVGIPTGFRELDDAIAYFPGDIDFVLAAPGVGKTTFMRTLQDDLGRRGIPTLFASAEQPAIQLVDRSVAAAARIDGWRIARGLLSQSEWITVNTVLGEMYEQPSYIYEAHGMTTTQLGSILHVAVAKFGIKVCFVDYVQLLADDYGQSDYSRVSYISRRLAQLAGQLKITIVAASQLSRKYATREKGALPEMTDARESGQIEQDAFVILGLARKPAPDDGIALLGVLKNRNGPSGLNMKLHFDPTHTRFSELDADE